MIASFVIQDIPWRIEVTWRGSKLRLEERGSHDGLEHTLSLQKSNGVSICDADIINATPMSLTCSRRFSDKQTTSSSCDF